MREALALSAAASLALTLARPAPAAAEATATLRADLPADVLDRFAVENLVGSMRARAGGGDRVSVVATVHAESEELLRSVRLERVEGDKGVPTLRVRYPLDRHDVLRAPRASGEAGEGSFLSWLVGGGSTAVKYDGHRVRVSGKEGVLLWAEVEVELPRRAGLGGTLRNLVGPLHAEEVEGRLAFDSASGDITLARLQGEIAADTGSGNVKAAAIGGSYSCDTGSGNCLLDGFRGESLRCDTGSGNVTIASATARRLQADTGSGNVRLSGIDAEEVKADTGSGNVELEAGSSDRLARVKIDTGSGNVKLVLGPGASFEVHADQGSGSLKSGYADAEAIRDGRSVVGYRRGAGRARIDVDTGSGNVVVAPGS